MACICFLSFFSLFLLILLMFPHRHPHRWVLFFLRSPPKKQPSPCSERFLLAKAHLPETSPLWCATCVKGRRCLEFTCEDSYAGRAALRSETGTGETSGVGVNGGLRGGALFEAADSQLSLNRLTVWLAALVPAPPTYIHNTPGYCGLLQAALLH